jgi:hypothetical protein
MAVAEARAGAAGVHVAGRSLAGRGAWIAGLVAIYLIVSIAGWRHSLIYDEIWYLLNAALPFEQQMATLRLDMFHPPLMYLITRGWLDVFGHTDTAAKALVLVLNTGTIALFTLLASLVVTRWRLASLLFCTAYLQIGGVPNLVRGYSLGILLTVAALLAWELWRRHARPAMLACWSAAMLGLVYTHYTALLFLIPFAAANWLYGHRRRLFLAIACAIGIAFAPWLLYVLPIYRTAEIDQHLGWIDQSAWVTLAKLPFHFLTYFPAGWNPLGENDWPRASAPRAAMMAGAIAIHAALFAFPARRLSAAWPPWSAAARRAPWPWLLIVFAAFPIAVLFSFSVLVYPSFNARFAIFVLPVYWLLIGSLVDLGGRPARWLVYAAVVPWLAASVAVPLARETAGGGLHGSVATVDRLLAPGDLVLAERVTGPQVYWWWTREFHRREPMVIVAGYRTQFVAPELPLQALDRVDLSDVGRVWFFSTAFNPAASADIRKAIVKSGLRHADSPPGGPQPYLSVFERR